MELVRSLGQFFDRAIYYAAIGYEQIQQSEPSHASSAHEVVGR
jgi:hypothetical protein